MHRTSAALCAVLLAAAATVAQAQGNKVDFGDDSSQYARDGECDDPRFTGEGMASSTSEDNVRRDATDCRAMFQAGMLRPVRTRAEASLAECASIDFGDDSSQWARDNECDDPRFGARARIRSATSRTCRRTPRTAGGCARPAASG